MTDSVYTLSSGMQDRLGRASRNSVRNSVRNSMRKDSGKLSMRNKMKEGCEVGRVRVCKPLKECHEIVTTKHVEKVPCDPCDPCESHHGHHEHHGYGYSSLGWAVLWFVIIAVIVWLIIFSLKPAWALNEDGDVDTGKVLLASIVIALIIVIIIWIVYMACRSSWY